MFDKIKQRLSEIYPNEPTETHKYASNEILRILIVELTEAVMEDLIEAKSNQEKIQGTGTNTCKA
jgi:hypothetical protein